MQYGLYFPFLKNKLQSCIYSSIAFSKITHVSCVGYYSYLYAKCFAATIWQKLCQEDPLSLATGTALRTKFFEHGGAKDPADLLTDLVGMGFSSPMMEG